MGAAKSKEKEAQPPISLTEKQRKVAHVDNNWHSVGHDRNYEIVKNAKGE